MRRAGHAWFRSVVTPARWRPNVCMVCPYPSLKPTVLQRLSCETVELPPRVWQSRPPERGLTLTSPCCRGTSPFLGLRPLRTKRTTLARFECRARLWIVVWRSLTPPSKIGKGSGEPRIIDLCHKQNSGSSNQISERNSYIILLRHYHLRALCARAGGKTDTASVAENRAMERQMRQNSGSS